MTIPYKDDPTPNVIRAYVAAQMCWICGKGGWKALSQHLSKKHGLPADEVRELAYMYRNERLISEELSASFSKVALRKFGKKKFSYTKGVPQAKKSLSKKGQDILRERMAEVRPLAAIAQRYRREAHNCGVCGKLIETSRPEHCCPECVHIASSQSAKKAMTPERIAHFNSIRRSPTPAEQSKRARGYWAKVKSWPIEQQKEFNLRRASSRIKRVIKCCVICGKTYDIIPSHSAESVTCGSDACKKENCRRNSMGRKHTPESIAKMRIRAKEMWKRRFAERGATFGEHLKNKRLYFLEGR